MKSIRILYLFSGIALLLAGCKKITDFNNDPNTLPVDKATPQLLFPSAVMSTAGHIHGEYAITGGLWAQYYTQSALASQYRTLDAFNVNTTDMNLAYRESYIGALNDYVKAQELATAEGNWKFNLMATVMKAYTLQVLADLYDMVPYSEAFKGQANLQPKFDDGYSIYKGLLAEIDAALAKDYKSGTLSSADAKADVVFNGSMDNWERFANTLKLKMYLRMVNAKPAEAEAGVKALYTANAKFLETTAGVDIFKDEPNFSNPFFEQNIRKLNTTTNLRASETFVSWLRANNDPRIVAYFGSTNPGTIHQGDFTSTNPAYGAAAVFVQHATDPVYFISEAESYFMQAEARERYYGGAGAKALYDAGVTAAFEQHGLAPGALLTGAYAYPVAGTFQQKLEAIIVQKWASFPGSHDLEGWFEKNRTGYPRTSPVYSTSASYVPGQLVYPKNGVTNGLFPKRLLFPDIERSRNSNTPAEVPITVKTWWGL
ncbi:MAG TPA: SusD/RagB family nutrient-binding outer membrane lipoprotein [Chitinophagaceae bacterium]|nr:SusD/RagB family nutrient-binding outer membrane lipoprotein [Chitinophagaceae bacterium]